TGSSPFRTLMEASEYSFLLVAIASAARPDNTHFGMMTDTHNCRKLAKSPTLSGCRCALNAQAVSTTTINTTSTIEAIEENAVMRAILDVFRGDEFLSAPAIPITRR
ncbi:MAG: hypothetical protein WA888_12305, partial [Burkholderiaceae bacterium]